MLTIIICSVVAFLAYRHNVDTIPAAMLTFSVMLALNPAFAGAAPFALAFAGGLVYVGMMLMPVAANGLQPFAVMAIVGKRRVGLRFEAVTA